MLMLSPRVSRLFVVSVLLTACGAQPSAPSLETISQPETPLLTDGLPEACTTDEWGCAVIQAGSPILIGTALTLTGADAARGLDSQYGAQVAVNLRGTVAGREVELVHHDDRCDPGGGTTAATELASLDGVVAVVGTSCSASAAPAAEILSASGIALVSPSNTAPWLTDRATRQPFYLRFAPNDVEHARVMAEFACSELGVATAATIADGSPWAVRLGESFSREFGRGCGGEVTAHAALDGGRGALSRALDEVAISSDGGPPELVYVSLPVNQGLEVWHLTRRTAGLADALLAGVRTGLDGGDLSFPLDGVDGVGELYLSAFDLGLSGQFYESIFLEEYARVSGMDTPLGAFHGQAYDAVNLVLDAVEAVAIQTAEGLYVPRGKLLEAVAATREYEGLTGRLTCSENGDCAETRVSVWQVQADELRQVWP